jgi:hypothetical protein
MRGIVCWAGVIGLAAGAPAQTPSTYPVAAPTSMPGTAVGKPIVQPVGNRIPRAVSPAGQPVGSTPGNKLPPTLDPQLPKPAGQQIDLKNVIAPYPGMPTPEKTFWEKLEERWFSMFYPSPPTTPPNPTGWTPGIGRRNRERAAERRERPWWQN